MFICKCTMGYSPAELSQDKTLLILILIPLKKIIKGNGNIYCWYYIIRLKKIELFCDFIYHIMWCSVAYNTLHYITVYWQWCLIDSDHDFDEYDSIREISTNIELFVLASAATKHWSMNYTYLIVIICLWKRSNLNN